jgi:hypothetical protein
LQHTVAIKFVTKHVWLLQEGPTGHWVPKDVPKPMGLIDPRPNGRIVTTDLPEMAVAAPIWPKG